MQNAESSIILFGMIKVSIKEIAIKNGIKTAYQLQKLMNLQPSMAAKWFKNDLKMIGIESLNSLCEALDCEPSDILKYTPSKGKAKNTIKSSAIAEKGTISSDSNPGFITTNQLADETGLSRKRINDFIVSGELKATKGKQKHNFISREEADRFKAERLRGK
ncbi:MAG: helix-turn-helix domain-containing protein [Tatlockia sp.]|nr:helix-turn-helix domain-containing protein [Tatlockia sp.]